MNTIGTFFSFTALETQELVIEDGIDLQSILPSECSEKLNCYNL